MKLVMVREIDLSEVLQDLLRRTKEFYIGISEEIVSIPINLLCCSGLTCIHVKAIGSKWNNYKCETNIVKSREAAILRFIY